MNIEDHKKAKPKHTGKDVRTQYDLKRERERAAVESVRFNMRRDAAAQAESEKKPAKRPRRMAAE